MTRRGSLAYYLAAWVCGCFFMSSAVWVKDLAGPSSDFASFRSVFGFLAFYFYGLSLGAFAALFGAFLLRRLAQLARCKNVWHWMIAGSVLAPALIAALGAIVKSAARHQRTLPSWLWLVSFGPSVVLDAGIWLAVPAGAATAWVLCRIHRAFAITAMQDEK